MAILIIDDSEDSRALLAKYLSKEGHDIILANGAQDAFKRLRVKGLATEKHEVTTPALKETGIDLILMDIAMPGIDGIEACKKILSDKHLCDIPIIIITAMKEDKLLNLSFKAGVFDFITKPINKVDLLARTSSALRFKQKEDEQKRKYLALKQSIENAQSKYEGKTSLENPSGTASRSHFNEQFRRECERAARNKSELSILLAEINECCNSSGGLRITPEEKVLTHINQCIRKNLHRPGDFVARYDLGKFAILLTETPEEGALTVAESLLSSIEKMVFKDQESGSEKNITVSFGVTSAGLESKPLPYKLFSAADKALSSAQSERRNNIKFVPANKKKRTIKIH